jgi:hypothetical protein
LRAKVAENRTSGKNNSRTSLPNLPNWPVLQGVPGRMVGRDGSEWMGCRELV